MNIKVGGGACHFPECGTNETKLFRNTPVTYIGIYEDRDISVGIFIIRRGCRIPLHNHPGMYGVIKVVHGKVDVATYTKVDQEQVQTGLVLTFMEPTINDEYLKPRRRQNKSDMS